MIRVMSFLEYGIPSRPASGPRQTAALLPYVAVLLGCVVLSSAWAALLLYQLGMVGCLLVWSPRLRPGPGWRRVPGLALARALAGGVPLLLLWIPLELDRTAGVRLQALGLHGLSLVSCFIVLATLHPILEELFWRGVLGSRRSRLEAGDVLFGGYHALVLSRFLPVPWVLLATASIILTGWMWRRLAAASGGLLLPMASHVAADLGILGAVLWRLHGS
jgi:membrane protease YdiL (CAAX protease family)